jgi:Protein of unknown function (DUF2939)
MRMTLSISSVLVGLWLAYAVSPFVGAYRLAAVVQQRDVAGLRERVDFTALRGSLAGQIATTYLRLTGKIIDPGLLRDRIAVGVAASIAEPLVAELITPEALLDLLQGKPSDVLPADAPRMDGLSAGTLDNVWRVYLSSELGIARFFLDLPVDRPRQETFRLQFCLRDWTWRLCGVELPEPLQVRLAQELMKREAR